MSIKKVGTVALILNSKFVVIKSDQPLILGSEVIVYDEINLKDKQNNDLEITQTIIPKGKLKIIMLQDDGVYLASTISKQNSVDTQENISLARSLSLYNQVFGNSDKELDNVTDKNIAEYSARIDTSKSIQADISPLVRPGDYVTFIQPSNINN